MKAAIIAVLLLVSQAAGAQVLSDVGTELGRVARDPGATDLVIAAQAEDTGISEGFIVARFQNNQPLMKTPDGAWTPWDGDPATLARIGVTNQDRAVLFPAGGWPTPDVLAPCTFTVGYWAGDIAKFGYITVDGF